MGRHRALRFVHPDFDQGQGLGVGLAVDPTGTLGMVEDEASIRQSLLLLLSTLPGERLMRPDYGCDLDRLAFQPADDTTRGLAIHYVRRAVTRWEPRAEIVNLVADYVPGAPYRLEITLEYRVRAALGTGRVTRTLDLTSPEA